MTRFDVRRAAEKHRRELGALRRDTAWRLVFVLLVLAATAQGAVRILSLSAAYPVKVVAICGIGAVLVFVGLSRHLPWRRFGVANGVTLARLALAGLVGGLIGEAAPATAWMAVIVATLVVSLDGVDGWLARRSGMESRFGARFDMEVDALLILMLAVLAWRLDKAGAWVLLAGAMRYGFVAGGRLWPWLQGPLPPSRRRKAVCVVQVFTLILCLVPWTINPWSDAVAAVGVAFLCYSFWVDIAWLRQHRYTVTEEKRA